MPSNKDHLYVALYARGGNPTMPGKEDTTTGDHAKCKSPIGLLTARSGSKRPVRCRRSRILYVDVAETSFLRQRLDEKAVDPYPPVNPYSVVFATRAVPLVT
ncbi:hypothetical protein IFM51744_10270 [Aspergillus udagawae]|nr:hypothetical protein IFM51744_10270 [Aspergillus udagawae]